MNDGWAAENLHVIRTLMERAALYRRALSPVSFCAGAIGVLAGAGGWWVGIDSPRRFVLFWMSVAVLTLATAFAIMRRQALKDAEPFWSPPTRRVAEAMLPALFAGLTAGLIFALPPWQTPLHGWWLPGIWMLLYGCAAHAAGFFMPRGIKLLGWLFALTGAALLLYVHDHAREAALPSLRLAHLVMGVAFGGLHLAYGAYLAITEKRNPGA